MESKKETARESQKLTIEILERIRKNAIRIKGLNKALEQGSNYDGLHGVRYDRERVTGGNPSGGLIDIVIKREKERDKLKRDYVSTLDRLLADRIILLNALDPLMVGSDSKSAIYTVIILNYYSLGEEIEEVAKELKMAPGYIRRLRGPAVKALLEAQ